MLQLPPGTCSFSGAHSLSPFLDFRLNLALADLWLGSPHRPRAPGRHTPPKCEVHMSWGSRQCLGGRGSGGGVQLGQGSRGQPAGRPGGRETRAGTRWVVPSSGVCGGRAAVDLGVGATGLGLPIRPPARRSRDSRRRAPAQRQCCSSLTRPLAALPGKPTLGVRAQLLHRPVSPSPLPGPQPKSGLLPPPSSRSGALLLICVPGAGSIAGAGEAAL